MLNALIAAAIGLAGIITPAASAGVLPGADQPTTTVIYALPTPSQTASGYTIRGGCLFLTFEQDVSTNGTNEGVIGDASVTTNPAGAPASATVTCYIKVNGTEVAGTRSTYSATTAPGVEAGMNPISFVAQATDVFALCQDVTFSTGLRMPERCVEATVQQLPPQPLLDAKQVADQLVDPVVCPILVSLHSATGGNVLGQVFIEPDGDTYVPFLLGTDPVYDCPPY